MQENEIIKLKTKMEKVLSKIYMPSQDDIIDGLNSDITQRKTNILKG